MDLVYMNVEKEDIGILSDYTLDLAFGSDENDFECVVDIDSHVCNEGYYLYFENSEYGGIVDEIAVNTKLENVTYSGRTWHGILDGKILSPDVGQDYLYLSGEANDVLKELVLRMGVDDLFSVSKENSGITMLNYKMDRYITGYQGIRKMLKSCGGKLTMSFQEGMIVLSAKPIGNYAENEQFDADQVDFDISKKYVKLNHVIGLGKGELKDRLVVHVYADQQGDISDTQYFVGVEEYAQTYDSPSTESADDLKEACAKKIRTSWDVDKIEFSFESDLESFDIGDVLSAKERVTGISVTSDITKKIVTISNSETKISYKIGE